METKYKILRIIIDVFTLLCFLASIGVGVLIVMALIKFIWG